ncbi:unnamed protein product [Penicillium salamii]|nr:unnamed protein product [Penicillium salamii]CAG8346377.1 unnamed protein product [Penicillium salamii]
MPLSNGSMRIQRLIVLLAIGVLAIFSLLLLRSPSSPQKPINLPPPEPIQHPQLHAGQNTYLPEKEHPISRLIGNAQQTFDHAHSQQSKTLAQAVEEYKRRYNMHPPPHFDKWFEFAQSKNVQLVDEFDSIYHSLLPFWGLKPKTIRERARETLGFDNAVLGVLIRDGKVSLTDGGGDDRKWQRDATAGMMGAFVKYLPDMDLVFNTHDEPRVILPSADLERLVQTAKDQILPAAFKKTPTNAWSARASDVNKGDRIDEVRTTRFNRFAHQPTWTNSRISCPVNSPARSLDDDAPDNVDPYAYGELGFIYNTTAASDICNTPSLRYTYGFFDRPNAFDVVHDLFPIFSQSKISSFQDIIYPSPWYWADKVPYDKKKDYEWDAKTNRMYWRGSTTGGFSRAGGWRRQHRQQFVDNVNALGTSKILSHQESSWVSQDVMRANYKDMFDVKFTLIGQCDPDDCNAQTEYFGVFKQTGQQDAWAHKYLVDIDGNAFSGRFHAFLHSNSFVYKIAIFREWHDEWLKPWVHYVPLSLKGNEYLESMRYFTSTDGSDSARQIASQGQSWAQKTLRNEDLEVWFFRLLLDMAKSFARALTGVIVFAYGLFTIALYALIPISKGTYFKRPTEKEKLELQLAHDRLWNLSKDFEGLSHHLLTLQSGFKFHFLSNDTPNTAETIGSEKPLVIFIHGFPDSWAIWRHIIKNPALQEAVSIVAIDLPGYGGTDSLDKYTATNVLEKLTELIVTLRTQYGVDTETESNKKKTVIVAHDWGCVLSMRLAAEAPSLAHRFILSNGPSMKLVESNIRRLLFSSKKMLGNAWRNPLQARVPLTQAFRTISPLFRQIFLSGYIFAMQLPIPFVNHFLTAGHLSLLRSIHIRSHGTAKYSTQDIAESMASSMGPSVAEAKTKTANGDSYPVTLQNERAFAHTIHMANYYRHRASTARWTKSIETVASLHSITPGAGRASSGAGLFNEGPPGALKASTTVFWGKNDLALDRRICLDGMSDFLVQGSQIVLLPRTGHWTPVETESRAALIKAVEWTVQGEKGEIGDALQTSYPGVQVTFSR